MPSQPEWRMLYVWDSPQETQVYYQECTSSLDDQLPELENIMQHISVPQLSDGGAFLRTALDSAC
jgi:hypothetical protein